MVKKNNSVSRYDKIKNILNKAQGNTIPDYQGYGAFWMSYDTLMTIELYGQRMIAPASDEDSDQSGYSGGGKKSCCDSAENTSKNPAEDDSAGKAVDTFPTSKKPGPEPDCWPSGGQSGSGGYSKSKRSDRSGLIKGLRGEYPFNESIFPPLLWDAERKVSAVDIQFIAEWIDSGCPEVEATDDETPSAKVSAVISVERDELLALSCGDKTHKVSKKCTNVDHKGIKGLGVRKEVSSLTVTELTRLRNALECMYQYNNHLLDERSFDYWARIHTNSCQHGWEQFLPWHRLYLYFFEQTLQDYDEHITLPYWAWTDYADVNVNTFNTKQLDIGIIPEAYRCWITVDGVNNLKKTGLFSAEEIANLESAAATGTTYNSGLRFLKAVHIPYELVKNPDTNTAEWASKTRVIYNELRNINPLWFPNRWPGAIISPTHYPTKANVDKMLALTGWSDFGGGPEYDHHFGALEQVHNGMHNFSGGQNSNYPPPSSLGITDPDPQNKENPPYGWMTDNRTTAFDPIFWAHHSNVDRLWARWQELHPDINPVELDGILAPWSLSVRDSISIKKLGYEYMRNSFHYPVSNEVGMTKFNSEKAPVTQEVLDTHRKADIRLHRVQLGNVFNATVRMFLNAPDANADTPMENNDHYVGEITTFHGTCYGGQGHCNLPLDKSRSFDKRQLHHHEPRNYRVDASEAVQRLLAKGEEDLDVNLVVVGIDGKPINDALFIDGVSLNFMD